MALPNPPTKLEELSWIPLAVLPQKLTGPKLQSESISSMADSNVVAINLLLLHSFQMKIFLISLPSLHVPSESCAPTMAFKTPENTGIIKGKRYYAYIYMYCFFFIIYFFYLFISLPSWSFPSLQGVKNTMHITRKLQIISIISSALPGDKMIWYTHGCNNRHQLHSSLQRCHVPYPYWSGLSS